MAMKSRQRLQLALLIFIVFGGLVARSGYWVFWAFAASLSVFVLIFGKAYLDLLFLDENEFLYEPNYKHWEKLNDPKY
jgi:hypothetical protein